MANPVVKLLSALSALSILLTGCTYVYFPYFLNHSDKPVEILLDLSGHEKPIPQKSIPYRKDILSINLRTYKKLDDSLPVSVSDAGIVSVIIPPHSTAMVRRLFDLPDCLVTLKQETRIDTIKIYQFDPDQSFKGIKRGFPATTYLYYYDYK
jgi:hypothetical protein